DASSAIDSAHYAAARARELDAIAGGEARFEPVAATVVASAVEESLAATADDVMSALAAGSAVVFAPGAARSGAVLAEALWEAGVPRELLILVDPGAGLDRVLATASEADRVLSSGSRAIARAYR